MTSAVKLSDEISEIARKARKAGRVLARLSNHERNLILQNMARVMEDNCVEILSANDRDCTIAEVEVRDLRMSRSLLDRLRTSEKGIADMAQKVRAVADLPDPLGKTLLVSQLESNLELRKISCPLGVIGIIFESRPDVIPQVGSLGIKSGNAVLLKGGSEAIETNTVLARLWTEVLASFDPRLESCVFLLRTREDVAAMLNLQGKIDLIVPRGSSEFVNYISRTSSIPVLGHGEGICHVYVDKDADLEKAWSIAFDAKVDYPAACNAAETLLVHEEIAQRFLPEIVRRLAGAGVKIRGCERTLSVCGDSQLEKADESDWATEYSDLCLSIKVVNDLAAAIDHIETYGSSHTESIVTEDHKAAREFLDAIDAAGVYHNVSTRFADGFRYGFGAEVGISTSKLHARGPVGLDGLTSYKYELLGNGQVVASHANRPTNNA